MNLREAWRHVAGGLVGPLVFVAATGLLELLVYNANPMAANARLRDEDAFFGFIRSLHLWSSRALLAGAAVHTAWVWLERRTTGRHLRAYMSGTILLGVLALAHMTGHALRWDAFAGRILAYEAAALPDIAGPYLADWQLPLHVGLLGGVALLITLLHLGFVGRGPALRVAPDAPRLAPPWRVPLVAILGLLVALAFLSPAPSGQAETAWPMSPFASAVEATGYDASFAASALAVVGLIGLVPLLERNSKVRRLTQLLLGAVFAASFWPA